MCGIDKTEIVLTGPFNSSSNQNYVCTKFSCLKYDLQCTYTEPDKTYNTTISEGSDQNVLLHAHCLSRLDSLAIKGKFDQRMLLSECAVAQIDPSFRSSHKTFC